MKSHVYLLLLACAALLLSWHTVQAQCTTCVDIELVIDNQDYDAAPGLVRAVPANITLSYVVTNTGTALLTNIVVTDDHLGQVCAIPSLASGTSQTCTAIVPAVLGQGSNLGTVQAQAVDLDGNPIGGVLSDSDPVYYAGFSAVLDKTANMTQSCVGDQVTYTVRLTMGGGVPGMELYDITIWDALLQKVLVPNDPYWVGGDLNGNGNLDFIDNNGDGLSEEIFLWRYTLPFSQTITNTVAGQIASRYTDPFTGISVFTGDHGPIDQVTVVAYPKMTFSTVVTKPDCGQQNGAIDLTVSGGVAPFVYNWATGSTTADITGLGVNIYTVTVTDANGCSATTSAQVVNDNAPSVTATITNVSCFGTNTGSINTTPTGAIPPYTFIWSTGATTEDINNLFIGTYVQSITDNAGCTNLIVAQITEPTALAISTNSYNPTCGSINGFITTSVTGGIAPYTYLWSNGATGQFNSALPPGTYTVLVTDAAGCTKTTSATVGQAAGPVITATVINATCFANNSGSINITTIGSGTPPYTYIWNDGITVKDRNNLSAGVYCLTVTDINGCFTTTCVTITQSSTLTASTVVTNAACGQNNSSIDLTVMGGTAPYTFQWNDSATTEDRAGLTADTYIVTVTDAAGCTQTTSATISPSVGPLITYTTQNVFCFGGANAGINITVTSGTTPYAYIWSDGGTTQDRAGLAAGIYCVTIIDANACTSTTCVNITQPVLLSLSAVSISGTCGNNNGAINITVAGGTVPYTYNWSTGSVTNNLVGVAAGNYTVTVTDANGCTTTSAIAVANLGNPSIDAQVTNVSCGGTSDGSIDLTISGGTFPAVYDWGHIAGTNNPEDQIGLSEGTYCVTVTDVNGCSANTCINIVKGLTITLQKTNTNCSGNSGSATVLTVNGTGPYTYIWSNGINSATITNLSIGTYTVTITDATACTGTASVHVDISQTISLSTTFTSAGCTGQNGTISLIVSNGVAPYTYLWSNFETTQNLSGLTAGTYTVTVTDAVGCTASTSRIVTNSTPVTVNGTITNPTCLGNSNGAIAITVSGGTGFLYDWADIVGTNNVKDRAGLIAGTYTITVTNNTQCSSSKTFTITDPAQVTMNDPADLIACQGELISVPFSPAPGVNFFWSNSNTAIGLPASGVGNINFITANVVADQTAIITVTPILGSCLGIPQSFTLTVNTLQLANLSQCDNTTFIEMQAAGSYVIDWSGAAGTGTEAFLNGIALDLAPGAYSATITNGNGCKAYPILAVAPNPAPCTYIYGAIRLDDNGDCIPQSTELPLSNWLVKAVGTTGTFYGHTQANGRYTVRVQPGTYAVWAIDPPNTVATVCQSAVLSTVPAVGDSANVDFAVQNLPDCPALSVDLTAAQLRRCTTGVYTVQYCNNGALPAPNSYIDLELDPQLSYLSSGVPATNLGNNTYRFQIGTLAPNFCNQFNINVYVSCASIQGQYHCSEAHIYPDTSCVPVDPNYTGAEVDVRAVCTADSLQFILKNVGTGPMSVPLGYIVIEDGIMFKSATNNPLPKGDSMTISLPANGSTWRIEANQEPLFPGLSQPQLSVEGCTTAGTFSTGFLGQFAVNDNPPAVDIDCTVNSGPFDPNDKQGFPVGYGDDHYIRPGTDIEYLIHFQNIGTDTAFNIVVLDTLSNWLDISTVRPGASSFPYFFEIKGSNILAFNFFNIRLPDSTTNAMGSTGFFKFRISPADTVPLETDIYNSAAIYFDYNQPVITNTTQHRIGENFVVVGAWEPTQPQYEVLVAPNPMTATAQIIIKGAPASGQYRLRVFDMQGRVVVEMPGSAPQFMVKKGDLNESIYLFGVELDGNLIGKGKIIIR